MKKYIFSSMLLLSLSGLQSMDRSDPRLSPAGQFEYFRAISGFIEKGEFEEACERIDFLRTTRRCFVSGEQLDDVETQLENAKRQYEEERKSKLRQGELLDLYSHIEADIYQTRDVKDIDAERASLIWLWETAKELDATPESLSAHMVRLLQIENCMVSEPNVALITDLVTYFERVSHVCAHRAFELIYYGDEHGRCSFPFERLFEEAKMESDIVKSQSMLEFLRIVGNEDLRTRVEIFMATGEDIAAQKVERHEAADLSYFGDLPMPHILELSPEERERTYLDASDDDLQTAWALAQQNGDMEVAAILADRASLQYIQQSGWGQE